MSNLFSCVPSVVETGHCYSRYHSSNRLQRNKIVCLTLFSIVIMLIEKKTFNLRSKNNPITKQTQWVNARVIWNIDIWNRHLGKKM